MLRVSEAELDALEARYQGIKKMILGFENNMLPACPHCESEDTAAVHEGVIGRTLISSATTKYKLPPNGPREGNYFCNACKAYFD